MAKPKKDLLLNLVTVRSASVTCGGNTVNGLTLLEEWEGLIKLGTPEGETIILDETDNLGSVQVCRVIKGSDGLMAQLTAPPPKPAVPEAQAAE